MEVVAWQQMRFRLKANTRVFVPGPYRSTPWLVCRPRSAATAVAITLAFVLLAACGAGGDRRATSAVSSTGTAWAVLAPPARGEIDGFTWALPFEAASLDPIRSV